MFAKRVTAIGNDRLWGGNTWSELHLPEQDVGIVGDCCATRLLQVYIASTSCHGHQGVFPFGVRCLVPRSSALFWTCGQRPVRHVQSGKNKIIYYVCVSNTFICYIHQCRTIFLTAYVPFDMLFSKILWPLMRSPIWRRHHDLFWPTNEYTKDKHNHFGTTEKPTWNRKSIFLFFKRRVRRNSPKHSSKFCSAIANDQISHLRLARRKW